MKKAIIFGSLIVFVLLASCLKPKKTTRKQYPGPMTPQTPCPGGC